MKKYYAILMLAAVAACMQIEQPMPVEEPEVPREQEETVQTYTMTVEASKGVDTKALSLGGENNKTLNATWAQGERVTVRNVTNNTDLGGYLEAQSSGASTTLKGNLTGTIEPNDKLVLKFLSPDYTNQNGTLEYIAAHCDYAESNEITVSAVSGNRITASDATFTNQQAIVKFTLKNKAGDASLNTNSLRINVGTQTYTVNRSGSLAPYYVAIPGFNGKTISMIAINGDTGYEYTKSGVSFTNGQYYEITVKMDNGHAYVDLGLPSGLLWATCNVGATTPEGYGDYFAWGEVEPYYSSLSPLTWKSGKEAGYTWASYRYSTNHDDSTISKYTGSDYSVLQPEDDAATYNWGLNWRMPTNAELQELIDNTNAEWTTINGVNGLKLKKNDDSVYIFLPSGVGFNGTDALHNNTAGEYWSSTAGTGNYAKKAMFNSTGSANAGNDGFRSLGRNVRAVWAL